MHLTNKDIAHIFRSIAAAYLLTGVNRFRTIAYQKAADTVEQMTREVYDFWENGKLNEIEGIGPTISQHLDEHFKDPAHSYLTKQLQLVPSTVYELMKAPGIGPKKAFKLVSHFKLLDPSTVVREVKKLAEDDRISGLESFGRKSQDDIIESLEIFERRNGQNDRMSLPTAYAMSEQILQYLKKNPHVQHIDTLGSLRRMVATIGDIDIAVVADKKDAANIIEYFINYPQVLTIEGKGPEKASIITKGGWRVDLRVIEMRQYGSMLQYFTGSKAHNIKLREFALKKGYSLNEFGIKQVKDKNSISAFAAEEKFYAFLGLQWVPPEIREGTDEIKLAAVKRLPDLIRLEDVKGEFHVHSSFNIEPSHDLGADTFGKMISLAKTLQYEYLGFSEHNPSQSGHSSAQIINLIKKKQSEIKKTALKNSFTCFNSLEVDISPDGSLAIPDEAIRYLDMMIVSIHSSFRMKKDEMTKRILKGLSYPKVKILGHPTGRLLSKREEIDADWDAIFAFAKEKNIALEINSWPERLDLPDMMAKTAIKNGNKLILGTDAHAAYQMNNMFYGVAVARRAWAMKSDIINTKSSEEIKKWIGA